MNPGSLPRLSNPQWEGLGRAAPLPQMSRASPQHGHPSPASYTVEQGPGPAEPAPSQFTVFDPGGAEEQGWQKEDFPSSERPPESALPGAWGTPDLDVRGSSVQANF